MIADDPTPVDDEFAGRLAECDDALATGRTTPDGESVDASVDPRLQRGLDCLRRLDRLRPSRTDTPRNGVDDPLSPVAHVGRFEIQRELGRGGFGIVYLAHDPALGRDVAIKVPHSEVLMTTDLRDRFRTEARAAAALDHPNLLPVYEVGEAGPFGYLVMAYCPGGSLGQWLRQRREPVPAREAAEMVRSLAEAVAHAHARGVLHRDIKPANVLLSGQSTDFADDGELKFPATADQLVPKLCDFGLAKLLDAAGATRSGAAVGTPAYMAPEQAAGQRDRIGAPADVYGLGALLYELLTGHPPFASETSAGLLRLVMYADPIPPRSERPGLPRDLETICLKCLEKEPRRRYESATALAEDLRRFLDHEPIVARPIGLIGRMTRWTGRHPAVAALAVALALALTGGIIGIYTQWGRAEALVDANAHERDDKLRATQQAESNYRQFREVVDRLGRLGTELDGRPGTDATRLAVLEEVLAYYERFQKDHSDDPDLRRDLANAAYRAGVLQCILGRSPAAIESLRHAGKLLDELLVSNPNDVELIRSRAGSYRFLGHAYKNMRNYPPALASYDASVRLQNRLLANSPESAQDAADIATTLLTSSSLRLNQTKMAAGEANLKQASEVLSQALITSPQDRALRLGMGRVAVQQASHLDFQRKRTEALAAYDRATQVFEELAKEQPTPEARFYLAQTNLDHGFLFMRLKKTVEGEPLIRRAGAELDRLCIEFPSNVTYRIYAAGAANQIAEMLTAQHSDQAIAAWRRASAMADKLVADFPTDPRLIDRKDWYRKRLADVLEAAGKHSEAAELRSASPR